MVRFFLACFLIGPLLIMAQKDSLNIKTDSLSIKKEGRFQVAGSVFKNSILSVPGDFSEMGRTISSDWKRTAMYAGGILGLIVIDKQTTSFFHDHVERIVDYRLPKIAIVNTNKAFVDYENAYILYPIVGLYAGSLLLNKKKGQVVAINAVKSISYSFLVSHILLKTVFARNRPQRKLSTDEPIVLPYTKNNWDFGNYGSPTYTPFDLRPANKINEGNAFPSFHATFYFSVAKVFQMEYNNYWIPYGVATIVFASHLKGHDHWISDLVLGGLVGTIIGRAVVKSSRKQMDKSQNTGLGYNPKKFKMTKYLAPQISPQSVGLHFVGTF
jgi:membrane-associated phospholipid phosphatase